MLAPDARRARPRPLDTRMRPMAMVALMGMAAAGLQAHAADPKTGAAPKTYQVASGRLAQSLMGFAAQAGVNLSLDNGQLAGLTAPALSGTYTVEEGFGRLLAGSGLRARSMSAGNYVLESAAAPAPTRTPARTAAPIEAGPPAAPALSAVTVSVTRLEQSTENAPQNILVIDRQEIDKQLAITSSTTQMLSNLIPSMTPAMQKMSNYGQTMRGLQPQILVDGIPQSSPMYTSIGRDMTTIDPSMIERIEVIQGANSSHGIGGMGGTINLVTQQAKAGKPQQHVSVEASTPTSQLKGETLSYKTTYGIHGSRDDIDYLLNLSYQSQGAFMDSRNQRIGTYDDQGDLMDSRSYDVMAKVGYAIDDSQRIGLTVNRFRIQNNNDYSLVTGNRNQGIVTTSQKRSAQGVAPYNDSLTVGANYDHYDLAGMKLNAALYYQTVDSLFRGNTRFLGGNVYDQSQASFDKFGAKLGLTTADFMDKTMRASFGIDLMRESSQQTLLNSGRYWVPNIDYTDVSPFVQLEYTPTASVKVVGGVRYEHASIDVDSFTTLPRYGNKYVEGGSFSFGKTLFNLGASWSPVEPLNLFANFSQGFKVPDMGKAIRGISVDGAQLSSVSYFQPDIADNFEAGFRLKGDKLALQASYFHTKVKPGTVISYSNDQWVANRYITQIDGVELSASYEVNQHHGVKLGYSHSRGRFDLNGDGKVDTKLNGANIAPDRVSIGWSAQWNERLSSTLQANWYVKRNFDGGNAVDTYDADQYRFSGYGIVDLSVGYKLPSGKLSLGIANVLNRQYVTYYSQSGIVGNDYFFAGQGRTLTVGYRHDF